MERHLRAHKKLQGFKGQGGEEGSDSGKDLSPYMQQNKATVRGGRALTHKHTKTAGGIHTWEWWEEKRKTYSIIRYNREKETWASDARLHLGSHRTETGKKKYSEPMWICQTNKKMY